MSCVMCHMSPVTCHVSRITCHMSHVKKNYIYIYFFLIILQKKLDKVVELVGGGSVINRPAPSSFNRPGVAGAVLQTPPSLTD